MTNQSALFGGEAVVAPREAWRPERVWAPRAAASVFGLRTESRPGAMERTCGPGKLTQAYGRVKATGRVWTG